MGYIGTHRMAWDVFDPRNGQTMVTTPDERFARRLAVALGYDYAPTGEGWIR